MAKPKTASPPLTDGFPHERIRNVLAGAFAPKARPTIGVDKGGQDRSAMVRAPYAQQPRATRRIDRTTRRRGNAYYKPGPNTYTGRGGTWSRYMVDTILACETTDGAEALHREKGQYLNNRLDFNWMVKKGFITITQGGL